MGLEIIKNQVVEHLNGGEAFYPIDKMLEEITFKKVSIRPPGLPYSFYELFYHIVYAQKDIIDFCLAEDYSQSDWPKDYWPKNQAPSNNDEWQKLKDGYFNDRKTLSNYIVKEETDLSEIVKHGEAQTLIREILLIIEHSAYHTGQMLVVLRLLDLHKN